MPRTPGAVLHRSHHVSRREARLLGPPRRRRHFLRLATSLRLPRQTTGVGASKQASNKTKHGISWLRKKTRSNPFSCILIGHPTGATMKKILLCLAFWPTAVLYFCTRGQPLQPSQLMNWPIATVVCVAGTPFNHFVRVFINHSLRAIGPSAGLHCSF